MLRTTDAIEAERYRRSGARLKRLAHDMALDLSIHAGIEPPELPDGLELGRLSSSQTLAEASAASTPPGHPDHGFWSTPGQRLTYWRQLLGGEVSGPIMQASREVRRRGRILAAIVITRMPAASWWDGGAWVPEVFVIPEYQGQGLGTLLLRHAIRASCDAGEQRLGLTVTDGNPAERLYQRLGFRRIRSTYFLEVAPLTEQAPD